MAQRAEAFARLHHAGVKNRFSGEDYIDHPERVVGHLPAVCAGLGIEVTDHLRAVAWLHDTFEDCEAVTEALLRETFGDEITDDVLLLSRNFEPGNDYYQRNRGRTKPVKLADIKDNTDPERMALLDPLNRARLTKKYKEAVTHLGGW